MINLTANQSPESFLSARLPAGRTVLGTAALPTAVWSDWSCVVRVVVSDPAALDPACADVVSLMGRVARAASRFRVDSEINWANVNAGRPVAVSRTFTNLLAAALDEARRSAGSVDPTVGLDLVRNGYDRDIHLVGDSDEPVAVAPSSRPSWRDVRLDRVAGLVVVPVGCALDLGATAKSQTADWAAADLCQRFGCDALVEIGGDLAVAGRKRDWQITVAERAGATAAAQRVTLGSGGLATSTTTIRRWRRGNVPMHHIVDPVTGAPATGTWRTVTVAADSATHANTCSTAAIVLGDQALGWLGGQRVAARLVDRSGQIVTTGGWPC